VSVTRRGAKRKRSGGFKSGNKRHELRGGEPGRAGRPGDPGGLRGDLDRNVDIDRDIDFDDDDDELTAALIGGVVGLGVGAAIADSDDID
jgi:hypothetical protein